MSDALQLNYTVSGDVSGQITVSSARPVSRKDLLSVLETVLSLQGFTMSKVGGTYVIGPADLAAGTIDAGGRTRPASASRSSRFASSPRGR
jgi:general secretion pathway protein D